MRPGKDRPDGLAGFPENVPINRGSAGDPKQSFFQVFGVFFDQFDMLIFRVVDFFVFLQQPGVFLAQVLQGDLSLLEQFAGFGP